MNEALLFMFAGATLTIAEGWLYVFPITFAAFAMILHDKRISMAVREGR
jgi:hypothetical protein